MTQRGRRVLWLALGLYIAAWGFGTDAMFPVAVGLALAPAVAWGWVRLLDRPMRLRRRAGHLELVEGQSFAVGLEVSADGGPLPGRAVVVDRVGERPVPTEVVRNGRMLRGRYEVASALRGPLPARRRRARHRRRLRARRGPDRARPLRRGHRLPAGLPARGPFHGRRRLVGRARPSAPSSHGGLRPALDPRPPAGREPAARPLALDGQAPEADGEGAPGHAPRRGLGAARRRRPGRGRRGARIGVRLPGARRGVAPAPAGRVRPAQLARDPRRHPYAHPGRRRRRTVGRRRSGRSPAPSPTRRGRSRRRSARARNAPTQGRRRPRVRRHGGHVGRSSPSGCSGCARRSATSRSCGSMRPTSPETAPTPPRARRRSA